MTHKGTRPLRAGALCSAHHRQGVARVWLPADQQYGCLEWLDRSPSIKDVDQTPARIIGTIGEAQYGYDDDDPTALPLVTIDFLLSRALTSTERRYLSAWAVGDPRLDRVSFPPTERNAKPRVTVETRANKLSNLVGVLDAQLSSVPEIAAAAEDMDAEHRLAVEAVIRAVNELPR